MVAPPLPQTPGSLPQGAVSPFPRSSLSPGSQSRDDERVALLFEINVELLQEVNRLQTEGHGGAISPQQLMQLRSEGKPDKMASEEYIQCLRRVQANLAWLMPRASTDSAGLAKAPPGPAHMTPPPHMVQLQSSYAQLTELFPGWKGLDRQSSQSAPSPGLHGPNPMATNGMTSAPAQAQA
ncbi:hypothetical protein DOTSEDRAFT_73295 [Dothistroma septosporum NZE10]|uniref:Uncharacterized protein n=1 Tax=Dothistroma septosporum (strain NZE10 / CBS 128990) TaxID=675120 RepID=N1PM54_DOTSN|nr:hypothetical protein DOTSEDRAFT_73295 [Dothistroma septosporum NZE10]